MGIYNNIFLVVYELKGIYIYTHTYPRLLNRGSDPQCVLNKCTLNECMMLLLVPVITKSSQ